MCVGKDHDDEMRGDTYIHTYIHAYIHIYIRVYVYTEALVHNEGVEVWIYSVDNAAAGEGEERRERWREMERDGERWREMERERTAIERLSGYLVIWLSVIAQMVLLPLTISPSHHPHVLLFLCGANVRHDKPCRVHRSNVAYVQ